MSFYVMRACINYSRVLEKLMKKKQGLVEDISTKLCNEFQLAVPLNPDRLKRGKKLSDQDVQANSEAALEKFYRAADEERLRHRLGVIGRARVAFGLQQRLLKAGYAAPLVKQVLLAMLVSVFVGNRR
jgi:hypothetical protein